MGISSIKIFFSCFLILKYPSVTLKILNPFQIILKYIITDGAKQDREQKSW